MNCGIEFYIGYSPERINPGDDAHALTKITKIVAGIYEKTKVNLKSEYSSWCHIAD
jgi:UDP-N-acetyl-D-mannosaminuronate dehydrogenase